MMSERKRRAIEDYKKHVVRGRVREFEKFGIVFVPGRREGGWLWDVDEEIKLYNCRSSGGVFNLGHCPPSTTNALKKALDYLDVGDHLLLSEYRAKLARRLSELTPEPLNQVMFGASGGEIVDFAIKLARAYTRRREVISVLGGYHGHTGLALAAGSPRFKDKFLVSYPEFKKAVFNDIDSLERVISENTAAVILETIPVTSGVLIPKEGYLPAVKDLCQEVGALLILDEVQAGLGRTGRLWGFEEWNVIPDIMVLGKGLSGAVYPITAAIYREELQEVFDDDPFVHLSSFGGAELGCVAAMTMLDEIATESFLSHVQEMASLFEVGLNELQDKYPDFIIDIRQRGLLMGVEFPSIEMGMLMTGALAANGVLANPSGNKPDTVILMPPLIITKEEVAFVLQALEKAILMVRPD